MDQNPIKPRYHYLVTSSRVLLVTQLYPCMSHRSRVHFNLFAIWSVDLDAASLEVESPSVAIDDAYLTWNSMDSVGRKCTPT